MKLHEAFNVIRGDVVAFIGAGGKTSTMINLGYELAEMGWRVLATTTTTIDEDQLGLLPHAISPDSGSSAISYALSQDNFVFLYDDIKGGAVYGPKPSWIPRLMDVVDSDILLIEADAASGLPLKAPFENEPVIPPETSLVVQVTSLSVIGKPLDEEHVYNAQAIIDRYGFPKGNRIRSPWLAQVIRDEALGLRNVPEGARTIAFLNQSSPRARNRARMIAKLALRTGRLNSVVIGSARAAQPVLEVQRPIGAVVLAAGLSSRMEQSKPLLPWGEKTIIEHIVSQLMAARIDHITVVTGHMAKEIKDVLKPYEVDIVYNRSYKTGEMLSSWKLGLQAMPTNIAASLIVLGDQPQIPSKVIWQVLHAYAEDSPDRIIAPSYKMRRGHPLLIGRKFWSDFINLPRDGSPRDVLSACAENTHYVIVDDDSILRDLDTPQDYQNELERAGLRSPR